MVINDNTVNNKWQNMLITTYQKINKWRKHIGSFSNKKYNTEQFFFFFISNIPSKYKEFLLKKSNITLFQNQIEYPGVN